MASELTNIIINFANLFWSILLAAFLCFIILFTFYSFKKSVIFKNRFDFRKPKEFLPAFYIFWFISHFGFTLSYLILKKVSGTENPYLYNNFFSPVLVLGVIVAGRSLVHVGKERHAKTLMYGVVSWSLILLTISLYVDPIYFSQFFIPSMIFSFAMIIVATPIEWFSEFIARRGAKKLSEIEK